jgi:PEP-CTERM motif
MNFSMTGRALRLMAALLSVSPLLASADSLVIDDFSLAGTTLPGSLDYTTTFITTPVDDLQFDCCRTRFANFDHAVTNVFGGTRKIALRNSVSISGGEGGLLLSHLPSAEKLVAVVAGQRFNQNSTFLFMDYIAGSAFALGESPILHIDFSELVTSKADNLVNMAVTAKDGLGVNHSYAVNLLEGSSFSASLALTNLISLKSLSISFGGSGPNAGTSTISSTVGLDKISITHTPQVVPPPVPEPGTYGLMLVGLSLIVGVAARVTCPDRTAGQRPEPAPASQRGPTTPGLIHCRSTSTATAGPAAA